MRFNHILKWISKVVYILIYLFYADHKSKWMQRISRTNGRIRFLNDDAPTSILVGNCGSLLYIIITRSWFINCTIWSSKNWHSEKTIITGFLTLQKFCYFSRKAPILCIKKNFNSLSSKTHEILSLRFMQSLKLTFWRNSKNPHDHNYNYKMFPTVLREIRIK